MSKVSKVTAQDVAAELLTKRPGLDQMQLHKLLYLVQAASLAWFDSPAFDDQRIEAWQHGPVVRGVAGTYMGYNHQTINEPAAGDPEALSTRLHWVVDEMLSEYSRFAGPALARLIKGDGSPWSVVRDGLSESDASNEEIPREMIRNFHRTVGLTPAELTEDEHQAAAAFFESGSPDDLADLFELATGQRPTVS